MFKLFWTSPPKKRTTFSSWPFDQRFWAIKNLFAQKIWLSLFFSIFGKNIFVLQRFSACKFFRRFKSWITCHSNCKFSVKRPKWNAKISSFLSNRHDPTYLMNCNEKKVAARMCHFQCHTLLAESDEVQPQQFHLKFGSSFGHTKHVDVNPKWASHTFRQTKPYNSHS